MDKMILANVSDFMSSNDTGNRLNIKCTDGKFPYVVNWYVSQVWEFLQTTDILSPGNQLSGDIKFLKYLLWKVQKQ